VLALDLGERRIGVAVSDPAGVIASPHTVLVRQADREADHRAVADLVAEVGAERVVVGLPLSLDGTEGPAARAAREEAGELAAAVGVPVEVHDERLTTVTAERALREGGRRGRKQRHKQRETVVDKVAAAVLLQSWLDGRGSTRDPEQ